MLKKINISLDNQTKILIVYIALTIVTLAVFWQVNLYDFINFDDQVYVTQNSHIRSGISLESFRWALVQNISIYGILWYGCLSCWIINFTA